MRFFVKYSFEVEIPEELEDSLPEDKLKEIGRELAVNINFQEHQRAHTEDNTIGCDVYIKIRNAYNEDW